MGLSKLEGLTPEMLAALRSQPPAMQIASVLNDTQLVALVAASVRSGSPSAMSIPAAERVGLAIEIVAEAIVQMQSGAMDRAAGRARERLALLDKQALVT